MAQRGSPEWWLDKLSKALDIRNKEVVKSQNWYSGKHELAPPPNNTAADVDGDARVAWNRMSQLGITNMLSPVVDSPTSKLRIEGFRFGNESIESDEVAWDVWQRNFLDADSDLANIAALSTGQVCVLVWAGEDGRSEITVEDPAQTIVAYEPGSRRKRAAALKRWQDDEGMVYATLYLPDGIYKYESTATGMRNQGLYLPQSAAATLVAWKPRESETESWPVPNPMGVVPLIEIAVNRPLEYRPYGGGVPVFQNQINEQRKINHTVVDMLLAMEHQAFRQRWVIGWKPPLDPKTGEIDRAKTLRAGASRLMIFDDSEAKVGEFSQSDFRPFLNVIEQWVKVIASTSATPPYAFLLGDMINVAADALARIEAVETSKIRRLSRELGEGWEEVLRLALRVENDPRWEDYSSSVIWSDTDNRTATEQADLATTMRELGVPDEVVFSTLPGVSQQEARRWAEQMPEEAPEPPPSGEPAPPSDSDTE